MSTCVDDMGGKSNTVVVSRPTIVFAATADATEDDVSFEDAREDGFHEDNKADGDYKSRSRYKPSPSSRRSHNEKERNRRSRMKRSCQMMRSLVPGLDEKTDKATVLEHAVNFLMHLAQCPLNECNDYQIQSQFTTATRVHLLRTSGNSMASSVTSSVEPTPRKKRRTSTGGTSSSSSSQQSTIVVQVIHEEQDAEMAQDLSQPKKKDDDKKSSQ